MFLYIGFTLDIHALETQTHLLEKNSQQENVSSSSSLQVFGNLHSTRMYIHKQRDVYHHQN